MFTELRSYMRVGSAHVIVSIGSQEQPFKFFIPEAMETNEGQRIFSLLSERYVPGGDTGQTVERPRRSYAYVSGELRLFHGEPEIVVTSADQITDGPPSE